MSSNAQFPRNPWLGGAVRPAVSARGTLRLFCFPHAGGSASIFRFWTSALSPAIDVCPVQLPGREDRWREPPLTDLAALAPMLAEGLAPLLAPPFAFFGHSMGAFVAFELSRTLRRHGRPGPDVLVVSGARAPQIPDPHPPTHRLPADEMLEQLRRFGGVPSELSKHREMMALLLPALQADLALCETYAYRAEPPLDCPIVVYGGAADDRVAREHLSPWETQTTRACRVRLFPGNHFFFLQESRTAVLHALREDVQPQSHTAAAPALVSPRAGIERAIATVWREVLQVPSVGLDDNFFDLGGNSLLAVVAITRLREATGTTLQVLDLFRYPTMRTLAAAMEADVARPRRAPEPARI